MTRNCTVGPDRAQDLTDSFGDLPDGVAKKALPETIRKVIATTS